MNVIDTDKSPILLIIFNRPDTTKEVFNAIKKYKPRKLYIAADGPRSNNITDQKKCSDAREVVSDKNIVWPCEVYRNYKDKNYGCRIGVSSAIDWFFKNVDKGIILEDDCLPDKSFFSFASEMLDKYEGDARIMHINGSNFQNGIIRGEADYFFSRLVHVWGWATWRDAWIKYDVDMKDLPAVIKSNSIKKIFNSQYVASFWISLFKHIKNKHIDTWDTQWNYAVFKNNGYTISPNKNLVLNIGFNSDATHTSNENAQYEVPKIDPLPAQLKHPQVFVCDKYADDYVVKTYYIKPVHTRLLSKLKHFLQSFIKGVK